MSTPAPSLEPRKRPVQRRSTFTVESIRAACIQVLLAQGAERLTTTRVAERAGVSVGTLYQYFPNKRALLHAVLERHLDGVVREVEAACTAARGADAATMAACLVGAFVDAKFRDAETSRALYAIGSDLGAPELVARFARRARRAVAATLATASDRRFAQPELVAFVLSTSAIGPVQGLVESAAPAPQVAAVRGELVRMAQAYLGAAGMAAVRAGRRAGKPSP